MKLKFGIKRWRGDKGAAPSKIRPPSLAERIGDLRPLKPLRDALARAYSPSIYVSGMSITPNHFASQLISLLLLAVPSAALLAAASYLSIGPSYLLLILAAPFIALTIYAARPYFETGKRKARCERELPFVATFLTMAAAASISLPSAIISISRMRYLSAFAKEALRIDKVRTLY
ncbi:MAG: hypothetical protein N3H32_05100, partial [Nitrososphaeria archaeon]|nr:hypothetical protein [Nitrososphaeria archaeon]